MEDNTSTDIHQELIELRDEVVNSVIPLVGQDGLTNEQKFTIALTAARSAENPIPLLKQAYQVANSIEDNNNKAEALLDVIQEIELLLEDEIYAETHTEELPENQQSDSTEQEVS